MTSPYVVNQFVISTCGCSALHCTPDEVVAPSYLDGVFVLHDAHKTMGAW